MIRSTVLLLSTALCAAQSSCPAAEPSSSVTLAVASGYSAHQIKADLSRPRSVVVDDRGQLLISGSEEGVVGLVLDTDGCSVQRKAVVVAGNDKDEFFNHGLALSPDGKTLYASTASSAFAWSYNSANLSASNRRELVSGMASGGHVTRTLLVPAQHPELLLISRGSNGNLDMETTSIASGRSMIKIFNTTAIAGAPLEYTADGVLLGWGLRNSVGVAENPRDGGIWSVENSADQIQRHGEDFHRDNPGEELNYHGELSALPEEAPNYGYPSCLAVYDAASVPRGGALRTGDQFALRPNATFTDATCNSAAFRSQRLTFAAHTAPLSLAFNGSAAAFVAFHGSWNRDSPVGYQVAVVEFGDDGQPRKPSDTKDPATSILWNTDLARCPEHCFRPAGIAVGTKGELFVTGDSTRDLWVVTRDRQAAAGDVRAGPAGKRSAGWQAVVAAVLSAAFWIM